MSRGRILVPTVELHRSTLALLVSLCAEHGIAPVPSLEWSARMRRVLGRAYAQLNLIRLSVWLDDQQAHDTLRHELAHIAAVDGVGSKSRREAPHGPRWREWAVRLGTNPRATSHIAPVNAPERPDRRRYWGIECPGCGYRLVRIRVLPGLYHRDCGPRNGVMRKVMRGGREPVTEWVREAAMPSQSS
ncbi:MAG: SprT-like domain-containing protein [Dehalococcoidia bacterium]